MHTRSGPLAGTTGPGASAPAGPVLSVVVPSFRQEASIAANLQVIVDRVERTGVPFEVIAVSDGSPDDTARQAAGTGDDRIRVVAYDRNMGKGYALRTGSLAARGEWVAWVDSDLDLDPALLTGFLALARDQQLQVVVGSKRHPDSDVDYPAQRRIYSWLYQQLVRALFHLDVRDTQVGMKLFRREVLEEVLPVVVVKRYAFDLEILAVARRFGVTRIAEAPIRLTYRFSGSGVDWRAIAQALWDTAAVFYRLRVLGYYDHRRVLAHRLAAHRVARMPSVTVIVTPGQEGGAATGDRLAAIAARIPRETPIMAVLPSGGADGGGTAGSVVAGDDVASAVAATAARVTTELVAFIDLDSVPTGHWLDAAIPLFGDPLVGAVAGPTVPNITGSVRSDAAAVLSESRLGVAGARVRHHVGAVREVGEFPLRNLIVRTDAVRTLMADGIRLDDQLCAHLMRRLGVSVLCSPDVVVTSTPRALYRPYLSHLFRHGLARGAASGETSGLRPRHVVPAAFVLALAAGPAMLSGGGWARRAWAATAFAYAATLAGFMVVQGLLHRPRLAMEVTAGAALSHVVFGTGVLHGLVRRVAGAARSGRRA